MGAVGMLSVRRFPRERGVSLSSQGTTPSLHVLTQTVCSALGLYFKLRSSDAYFKVALVFHSCTTNGVRLRDTV